MDNTVKFERLIGYTNIEGEEKANCIPVFSLNGIEFSYLDVEAAMEEIPSYEIKK